MQALVLLRQHPIFTGISEQTLYLLAFEKLRLREFNEG